MKLDPAEAHLILGAVAEARSDLVGAEREARLALGSQDRPRVPAMIMLARVLAQEQKLDEALAVANHAVERVEQEGAHPVPTLAAIRKPRLRSAKR